jgi:hypothetical protein
MLAYWDKDLICRYANSAYVDWFGKTKEEMINNIRIDELGCISNCRTNISKFNELTFIL